MSDKKTEGSETAFPYGDEREHAARPSSKDDDRPREHKPTDETDAWEAYKKARAIRTEAEEVEREAWLVWRAKEEGVR